MRFRFGRNWTSYSRQALSAERVQQAREAFHSLIPPPELEGRRFLDVGFGQGLALFLAAESGAKVTGIDVDPENEAAVLATSRYFPGVPFPQLLFGSILDDDFLNRQGWIGSFDIVHSWGVLHHTGNLYQALTNSARLVRPGGLFVISIYQTHWSSGAWLWIKRFYNLVPAIGQKMLVCTLYPVILLAKFMVTGANPYTKERGMDFFHDVIDWVGGYPYEHATVEEICEFLNQKGFRSISFKAAQVPTGCNEFVFRRDVA